MNIRLADERDVSLWNAFVFEYGSFLQSWQWGVMQEELGVSYWRFVVINQGVQAVMLVVRRELPLGRCWLYVPRGPVFSSLELWPILQKQLIALAKEQQAVFVRIDPAWSVKEVDLKRWRKADREVQPRHTLILDLQQSEDDIFAGMHAKTRYNVRLAERKGVKVDFSTSIEEFLQLSRDVSRRSHFQYHPDEYYEAMVHALADENMVEAAVARFDDKPLAAHIMIYAGDTAAYVHGASSGDYRGMMGPLLLYWRTIHRAKEKGLKKYDFFGVAPPDADVHHPWAGITRVKMGFGGERSSYIGAYDLVMNEGVYSAFGIAKKMRLLFK